MDIKKNVKNGGIAIHPFKEKNFEDANICVTASKFVWSIDKIEEGKNKCFLENKDGREYIEIPAKQSALIFSQEAIYIGEKLAGICLPRVSLLSRGLLCTGGPMKPGRAESLAITVYNPTNKSIEVNIGEKIAVLMFYELTTKYKPTQSEKELNSTIDSFLKDCADHNGMVQELKALRDQYNDGESIRRDMKEGNTNDFKRFVKGNNWLVKLKRNKLFACSGLLFIIQLVVLMLGKLRLQEIPSSILEILSVTTTSTGSICIPLWAKKIDE
ncbi:MAG: hypothetical protein LBL58_06920 [Tannerellaceae bacterium]|nr:hypothetical protein [Tannerellaceae bacterium]